MGSVYPVFKEFDCCLLPRACCLLMRFERSAAVERLERLERFAANRRQALAPALVEAYAVLTRLPPPHRLSPDMALALLENNFLKLATVIALLRIIKYSDFW